jgi:acetyltransferase-like isoleucine patch superfamily enzyme
MRELLSRLVNRVPKSGTIHAASGDTPRANRLDRENVDPTRVHILRGGQRLTLTDRVIALLRSPNPLSRKAKAMVQAVFRAELPPSPVYKLLANERFFRRVVLRNVVRAVYHQPILRTMCASAGDRLMLDAGTGIPVIYGIDVLLGDGVRLSGRSTFAGALRNDGRRPRLVVGNETYLGHRLIISADDEVKIGSHVHVADDVYICGYDAHPMDPRARRTQPGPVDYTGQSCILIDDDVWICQGAMILKGIHIGNGAVVGAHAVVTRDVPAGAIVAGNPARVIGSVTELPSATESRSVG